MKAILFVIFSLVALQTTSAQSRLDSTIAYNFITPTDSVLDYKYEYAYDDKGKRTLLVDYNWDATKNNWINNSKYESTYDDKGKKILEIAYDWNANKNDWMGRYKIEYAYDDKGNQTLYASYNWDAIKNDWVGSFKYEIYGNK
jgi:Family of unknown function (DUF3836)